MNTEPEWQFENTKDNVLGTPSPAAIAKYKMLGYSSEDFYDHFPCFVGARTIARYLSLYQCYQTTLGIAGHIAEVGVYRERRHCFSQSSRCCTSRLR
jgi:hypothetical protein